LAFNKPAGLAAQAGSGLSEDLETLAKGAFGRPGKPGPYLVHRLDRETSGVILMARTKPAAAFYSAVFAERRARKRYLAIVCGGPPNPSSGAIDAALVKTRKGRVEIVALAAQGQAGAMHALTQFATLAARPDAALLGLFPVTGRMHQLRVHLAQIGRPIAGDGKYGGLFSVAGWAVPRLMLHAAHLVCPHPEGGVLTIAAPIPSDFHALGAGLGFQEALDDPALAVDAKIG
jgi:RluA family pseudouridine synthase